jgi:hypothetical protein
MTQSLVDLNLAGGVVQMVISPEDMGDFHGGIIHHHRKIIGGEAVAPQNDEIIQFRIIKFHATLDEIFHDGLPFPRGKKAYGVRPLGIRRFPVEARAIVLGFEPGLESHLSLRFQLLRRTVTPIRLSLFQQSLCGLLIEGNPLRLIKGPFIPIHSQPGHGIQDHLNRFRGRSGHIRIFNPKNEGPLLMTG